jgi:hypothetical protein
MTRWQEFPLRPQQQPWPGLNTKDGRLDPGLGVLEDGSFNAFINESDILTKRKGFVRGLDERFTGPVCGLFKYTSDCGVEYLVVADQDGVKVRTPFDIPRYLGSDSLPNDDFTTLDTTRWSNTTDYQVVVLGLTLNNTANVVLDDFVPESRLMTWFKESALTSYQVEIQYALQPSTVDTQVVGVAIKQNTASSTFLAANIVLTSTGYTMTLQSVEGGTRTTLGSVALEGSALASGFLLLSYNAETRLVTARAVPSGGPQQALTSTLSSLQDAALGQWSSLGIARAGSEDPEIIQVRGSAYGS